MKVQVKPFFMSGLTLTGLARPSMHPVRMALIPMDIRGLQSFTILRTLIIRARDGVAKTSLKMPTTMRFSRRIMRTTKNLGLLQMDELGLAVKTSGLEIR